MMMTEEFQESDVIFSDEYDSSSGGSSNEHSFNCRELKARAKKQRRNKQKSGSVPIHIPTNVSICSSSTDYSDEDDQMMPPHLIVARRVEAGMAFSVKGGYGRALKGRELSKVRTSILRMTGFLES